MRARRVLIEIAVSLAAAVAVAGAAAPAASADAAAIDFLDAFGKSDPVAGIGRTYVLTGSSEAVKHVYVKVRATGGAPCAPAANTDSGDIVSDDYWYGNEVNGSFRLTFNNTWYTPGTYLFCVWIADSSIATAAPIAQTITFRNPVGTISATTTPVIPLAGQTATVTVTGASEAPQWVYAKVRRAGGAPCGPSYTVDAGESVISGVEVNGSFSTTATVAQERSGTYLLCLWLADSSDDPSPVAGPQAVTYVVAAPCVVPSVGPRMTLARARAALTRSHCTAGAVKRKYSRTRKKRRVIRFAPRSGRRLQPAASVEIVVSKGKRKRR